ncbi:MAG: sulfatase-like hydrolase/transferase [Bacteroidota bacterium]
MQQLFFFPIRYIKAMLLFFILFQISRLYFISYHTGITDDNLFTIWLNAVWHGARLDLSTSAYCVTPLLLIYFFEILFQKPMAILHKIIMALAMAIIVLISITDAELFAKWGSKFSSQVLVYISHPKEMALSAGDTNWLKVLLFATIFIGITVFIYKFGKRMIPLNTLVSRLQLITLVLLMAINFVVIRGGIGVATISQSSAIYSEKSFNNAVAINSLWNALYFIMANTDEIYGTQLNYLSENELSTRFAAQLHPEHDTTNLLTTTRPNIVVIMLESFTANASQYFSGNNNCTPYLDSIAKGGVSFMKCYSSGDRTEKGLVTVISGYPAQPLSSIIVFPDKMAKLPGISKVLKGNGYHNYYFYGGDAEFAAMKSYLVVQQFDEIIDKSFLDPKVLTSKWGAHDEHLFNKVQETLDKAPQPFFSTVMTLSSHEPFDVPYKGHQAAGEWFPFMNSIEYADLQLFRFLEAAKQQAWYNNTLFILVADHGHDIGLKDVHFFGPEKYHIPLILTGGALKKEWCGKRIEHVVSQTGIPAFICSQLNLPDQQFAWQTGLMQADGFAQYEYNNGFGRLNNQMNCLFDNSSQKCYYYKGTGDSSAFVNDGKAFQQQLVKDFLSK